MAKLEFIKNHNCNLFPLGSKIRYHFRYNRWPTTMIVAKHIECSAERVAGCSTACDKIMYQAKCGTQHCGKLGWRLISE